MKKVIAELDELNISCNNIVVAVSGGVDSMVLLNILNNIKSKLKVEIVCAHVNHNVRKESEKEAIFVQNFCKKNNIIYEEFLIKKYSGENFQADARNQRYNFFEKLLLKYNSNALFTAHHGDDLIETILMKILRGSSLNGYAGFQKRDARKFYIIYRPFIYVDKETIIEYANKYNISYVTDQSNEKDNYKRNRIRKKILPELKKENSNAVERFLKYSERLKKSDDYFQKIVKSIYKQNLENGKIKISSIKQEEQIVIESIVIEYVKDINPVLLNKLGERHLNSIFQVIKNLQPNIKINLPDDYCFFREYDYIYIKKDNSSEKKIKYKYKYEIENEIILPNGKKIKKVKSSELENNFVTYLNYSDVELPLFVRNRLDGDSLNIKGMDGRRKIKDIFIDEKISIEERNSWPIVVDSQGIIVWIPGLKKTNLDKTKEKKCDIILEYS